MEDYDKAIVEAAEAWAGIVGTPSLRVPEVTALFEAVQAKREAQRPRCEWAEDEAVSICAAPAIQTVTYMDTSRAIVAGFRCAEHRVTVTEL